MKFMFLLNFLSLAVFANDPKVFIGKYSVVDCPLYEMTKGDYERGYIKLNKNVLELNLYGQEALIDEFVFSTEARRVPGTDPDIHGEVFEKTEAEWVSATDVKLNKVITRNGNVISIENKTRLQLKKDKLTITSTYTTDTPDICVLKKK